MLNSSLKNARFLIIDDQEANIVLLESQLESFGYTDFISTTDSRKSVDHFINYQPDLILLDLHMPHLNGFQVMELLRGHIKPDDFLPILVLTADISPEVRRQALAKGAKDFLTKPLDITEVSLRIMNLLETRFLNLQLKYQNQVLEERIQLRTAEISQRADDMALIHKVNIAVNRGDEIQNIIELISGELFRNFNCIGSITAFPNPDGEFMSFQHIEFPSGLAKKIEDLTGGSILSLPLKIPMKGSSQFAQVIRSGVPIAINDENIIKTAMAEFTDNTILKRLADTVYNLLQIKSMILLPLISGAEVFGMLEIVRSDITTETDLQRIHSITLQLTTAIGRKKSLAQLKESEEKFKTLFDTANDGIIIMNAGTFLDCNETTLKIFKCTRDQIINHSPVELSPEYQPDGSTSVQSAEIKIQEALSGKPQFFEWLHSRVDGTTFYTEVSLNRVFLGGEFFLQAIVRDIDARKKAEKAIFEQNKFTTALVETAPALVYVYDIETKKNIFVNDGLIKVLGISESRVQEMNADLFTCLTHPDDLPAMTAFQSRIASASDQEVLDIECRIQQNEKRWINIHLFERPFLRNKDGSLKQKIGVGIDITEKKHAEDLLQESSERLKEAQRIALIGNWELNLVEKQLVCSDEIYTIYEIDPQKLDPSIELFQQAIHPGDLAAVQLTFSSSLKTDISCEIDHRLLMPDGRIKYINQNFVTYFDHNGQAIRMVGTVQDISERQKAEAALFESEERFYTIFHASPIPILIIRVQDNKFIDVNEAFQNMSGYRREDVIGYSVYDLQQWVDPDELNRMEKSLREHEIVRDYEAKLRTKTGEIQDVLMSAAPIELNGEHFIVNMVIDISTRKKREHELQAIASLSNELRKTSTGAEMLAVIVLQLVNLLNCDTVSIEMIEKETGDAVTKAAVGTWEALIGTHQKAGTGINAIIARTGQPYIARDMKYDPNLAFPEWTGSEIHGGMGVPLIAQDHLIGYIWMGRRTEISESEIGLCTSVANIAANALYRVTLFEQSQQYAADLVQAYNTTLEGWAHALELRDHETEGHTRRVVQMTVELAKAMGIDTTELENVRRGALLHDIGKIGVPDAVLLKPGQLNESEWEIMRKHPDYAQKFLEPIGYLRPVIDIPYCHHEKWDGSGYPRGLKGNEIPFMARIFSIVDVWDALRSDRPYRAAWPREKAKSYIQEQSGIYFDPKVVPVFLDLVGSSPLYVNGLH
ncbi:MAG: PAS domain S-box protein [Chloroflexota bacterium]